MPSMAACMSTSQNRNLNAVDSQLALSLVSNNLPVNNTPYDNNRYGGRIGGPIIKNGARASLPTGNTTRSRATAFPPGAFRLQPDMRRSRVTPA